jgi:phage-related tail protein
LNIPALAKGTNYASAGWTWVGENGPELLRMNGGEQVMPNRESRDYAKRWMSGWHGGSGGHCFDDTGLEGVASRIEGSRSGDERGVNVEFNFNGPVSNGDDVRRAVDESIPKLRSALMAGSGRR